MDKNTKTYIIGCGCGRCGTKSLATLLNKCKNMNVSHEFRRPNKNHYLNWYYNEQAFYRRYNDFLNIKEDFVGDIASYYLNYLEKFRALLPNLKIIYLDRPTPEIVNSFIIKTQEPVGPERNHWLSHKHKLFKTGRFKKMRWDICFPKYRIYNTKRELIRKYCENYKKRIKRLINQYPGSILSINIHDFDKQETQKEIYDFIGIPESYRKYKIVRKNVGIKH